MGFTPTTIGDAIEEEPAAIGMFMAIDFFELEIIRIEEWIEVENDEDFELWENGGEASDWEDAFEGSEIEEVFWETCEHYRPKMRSECWNCEIEEVFGDGETCEHYWPKMRSECWDCEIEELFWQTCEHYWPKVRSECWNCESGD